MPSSAFGCEIGLEAPHLLIAVAPDGEVIPAATSVPDVMRSAAKT
jgi:hypothetical protein